MTRQEQIYNWLTTALQQPDDRISEIFYYDKRDNEFFSILVTDYFMFDENLNIAPDTTTTYTKDDLATLMDRVKRIDCEDPAIIPLPRLGNTAQINNPAYITQQAESFLNLNAIHINTATIWEVAESGTIIIGLEAAPVIKKPWWKLWK